jgi:AcrR family transcriptional regulator
LATASAKVCRPKLSSRDRLLAAATDAFCRDGYFSVSVEDIAIAAGVSIDAAIFGDYQA